MSRRRVRRPIGPLGVVLVAAALAGCAGDAPPESGPTEGAGQPGSDTAVAASSSGATAVSREEFVETYVALRYQAVQSQGNELSPRERTRILEEHGVTEEELVAFVEAHGRDPSYMESVWSDIESRLDALQEPDRAAPDSAG